MVYLCLNKPLSFYTVDVLQNVKCLFFQLRVSCVRWIIAHLRLKPTLSLSPVILSKHKSLRKHQMMMKSLWLMTQLWRVRLSNQVTSTKKVLWSSQSFMGLWVRMDLSKVSLKLLRCLTWVPMSFHQALPWTRLRPSTFSKLWVYLRLPTLSSSRVKIWTQQWLELCKNWPSQFL